MIEIRLAPLGKSRKDGQCMFPIKFTGDYTVRGFIEEVRTKFNLNYGTFEIRDDRGNELASVEYKRTTVSDPLRGELFDRNIDKYLTRAYKCYTRHPRKIDFVITVMD